MRKFNPIYVLYDMVLSKPIGYYGITEGERLDKDVEEYLKSHPTYRHQDLTLAFDRWGLTLPKIGVDEFL